MTCRIVCAPFRRSILSALALAAIAATSAACQAGRASGKQTAPDTQWGRDSAKYVKDSIKWVHDSLVIDSIARTINLDSLYHLYRSQLRAEDPVPVQRAIDCEMAKQSWLHGSNAAQDAYHRMLDTVYRKTDSADMKRVSGRLRSMSVAEMASLSVGERQCGKFSRWGPQHPDSVDGAPLLGRGGRPAPPRRPM